MDFKPVIDAYKKQFAENGDTPQGLFSRNEEATENRLRQLLPIVKKPWFTALDFGCGTGAIIPMLEKLGMKDYVGVENCSDVRKTAQKKYPKYEFRAGWPPRGFDYVFASGPFNAKFSLSQEEWTAWVSMTVRTLWQKSHCGLAMNFLTYKPDWKEDYLWYPESPEQILGWLRKYNQEVKFKVVENYGLHEFTVLVER